MAQEQEGSWLSRASNISIAYYEVEASSDLKWCVEKPGLSPACASTFPSSRCFLACCSQQAVPFCSSLDGTPASAVSFIQVLWEDDGGWHTPAVPTGRHLSADFRWRGKCSCNPGICAIGPELASGKSCLACTWCTLRDGLPASVHTYAWLLASSAFKICHPGTSCCSSTRLRA